MNIVLQLREQAAEIAAEGHFGWGNTMLEAARIIEELQAAQQSVQADGLPAEYIYCECPSCKATGLPELFIRRR